MPIDFVAFLQQKHLSATFGEFLGVI